MRDDIRYFKVSASVRAENSAGPLLDTSGNVIGVVNSKLNALKVMIASDDLPRNANFVVKAAMLATFLDADRVGYAMSTAANAPLQPADIADQARAMSAFVVCR